ncbi:hypothetical protein DXG03_001294 [Asterophora parasitica]|uniref:Uncharacterized protein n=1 Tax=Asterophora parasitica TaxID=117018 RepID=A0A9P7KBN2_9AGAR|nr:hypothetical protein DXG03_001294 [Asterophora parasitica]
MTSPVDLTPIDKYLFPRYALASYWNGMLHSNELHYADLLAGSFVHKLFFVKAKSGAQHEYIMAEIHNRLGVEPSVRFLRLERSCSYHKTLRNAERQAHRSPKRRDSTAQAVLDAISDASSDIWKPRTHDAVDTIRECPDWVQNNIVYTITFPNDTHAPSLKDLASAAYVTTKFDERYSLLFRQCYWWADTLVATIESSIGEEYTFSDKPTEKRYDCSGSFRYKGIKIPIYTRNRANVKHLKSRFDAQKAYYVDLAKRTADQNVCVETDEVERRERVRIQAEQDDEPARTKWWRAFWPRRKVPSLHTRLHKQFSPAPLQATLTYCFLASLPCPFIL